MRAEVTHAYARSISTIWLVNTPLSALGLVLVVFIRAYSLHRTVIRQGADETSDPEQGEAVKKEKASGGADFNEAEEAATTNDDVIVMERTPCGHGGKVHAGDGQRK